MPAQSSVGRHMAVIWQRFLPSHVARLRRLRQRCKESAYRLTTIEVASQDRSYADFPGDRTNDDADICCFPGMNYHDLAVDDVYAAVLNALNVTRPDVVFAPATPFPEGMAAVAYRMASTSRVVMMDDAWEHTDQRGRLVRIVKRLIHRNIDGAFIPAPSHAAYYQSLGFDPERIAYGVDVVDNDFFARAADHARANAQTLRDLYGLPERYFLFVGRFIRQKGLPILLSAYEQYRANPPAKWDLVLVGAGDDTEAPSNCNIAGVHLLGPQFGEKLAHIYGLAAVLVAPSVSDTWGLVVNEALAAGLPVIASNAVGATKTLVQEGRNGWIVPSDNVPELAAAMIAAGACSNYSLDRMGAESRDIVSPWSLDRFSDGIFAALQFERAAQPHLLARAAARKWKGRIGLT